MTPNVPINRLCTVFSLNRLSLEPVTGEELLCHNVVTPTAVWQLPQSPLPLTGWWTVLVLEAFSRVFHEQ